MEYILDLSQIEEKEELHAMLSEILELPKYYGKNLDGFYDVMSTRSEEMTIVVKVNHKENEALEKYLNQLHQVLVDLENECENIFVEWTVIPAKDL